MLEVPLSCGARSSRSSISDTNWPDPAKGMCHVKYFSRSNGDVHQLFRVRKAVPHLFCPLQLIEGVVSEKLVYVSSAHAARLRVCPQGECKKVDEGGFRLTRVLKLSRSAGLVRCVREQCHLCDRLEVAFVWLQQLQRG